MRRWNERTEIAPQRFIRWLGVAPSKFYGWRARYGKVNDHNGWIPHDFWLQKWEKRAIVDFHDRYPLEGYRRLTFMVLDAKLMAVSLGARLAGPALGGPAGALERQAVKQGQGLPAASGAAVLRQDAILVLQKQPPKDRSLGPSLCASVSGP